MRKKEKLLDKLFKYCKAQPEIFNLPLKSLGKLFDTENTYVALLKKQLIQQNKIEQLTKGGNGRVKSTYRLVKAKKDRKGGAK